MKQNLLKMVDLLWKNCLQKIFEKLVSRIFEKKNLILIFSKRATYLIFLITNPERGVFKDV